MLDGTRRRSRLDLDRPTIHLHRPFARPTQTCPRERRAAARAIAASIRDRSVGQHPRTVSFLKSGLRGKTDRWTTSLTERASAGSFNGYVGATSAIARSVPAV